MPDQKTTAPKAYSGQDLANLLKVEGIKLRRYIREDGTRVGRGRTYSFGTEEARSILEGFVARSEKIELAPEAEGYDEEKATHLKAEVDALLNPPAEEDAPEADEKE
jgi:hypothetical protein